MKAPRSKPGRHGTLYLYAVPYGEEGWHGEWRCYAYDAEHAAMKFDDNEPDGGWVRTGQPVRVR